MKMLVNKDVLPIRKEADSFSELLDEVLYGMPVQILKEFEKDNEIWCYIKTEYRYEGWCLKKYLYGDEKSADLWDKKNLKVIIQPYADILSEPKVQGICLQSVTIGGRISVTGEKSGWLETELVNGKKGYIKKSYTSPLYKKPFTFDEEVFRNRIAKMAQKYLGVQYRWGGKSSLGIDCSGLASMSYMLCGVYIFRDAHIKEGFPVHEIKKEDLKKGDLIYFPGHIAVYLGNGKYIHSTAKDGSDGVVINSLNEKDPDYREDLPGKILYYGSVF